jgi:hypothetical protein
MQNLLNLYFITKFSLKNGHKKACHRILKSNTVYFSSIEVFDSDTIGKDKSLGRVEVDVGTGGIPESWVPLQGVKSGEILLRAAFIPAASPPVANKVSCSLVVSDLHTKAKIQYFSQNSQKNS